MRFDNVIEEVKNGKSTFRLQSKRKVKKTERIYTSIESYNTKEEAEQKLIAHNKRKVV